MTSPVGNQRLLSDITSKSAVQDARFRGLLHSLDLVKFGEVIAESGFTDLMTVTLTSWYSGFIADLSSEEEREKVIKDYIEALRDLLMDPIRRGDLLDATAVLGSDGFTYNELSLVGFLTTTPKEYQQRSPLAINNPTPLTRTSHPVVRFAVKWLAEKESAFLLKREEEEKEEAIKALARATQYARLREMHEKARVRKREEQVLIKERCTHVKTEKVKNFKLRAQEALASVGRSAASCSQTAEAFDAKCVAYKEEEDESIRSIRETFVNDNDTAYLEGLLQERLIEASAEDQDAFQEVYTQLTTAYDELDPLKEMLDECDERLAVQREHDKEHFLHIEKELALLEEKRNALRQRSDELRLSQEIVDIRIGHVEQQQGVIRQGLTQVRTDIEQMHERSSNSLIESLGIGALAIFGSWALAKFAITLLPKEGGLMLLQTIRI
ncbi:MAG: hypothetical protein P4L16_04410 [Chlamydiales bacterium]|nr:hypothetical protein [Chlamydiales bacterium]